MLSAISVRLPRFAGATSPLPSRQAAAALLEVRSPTASVIERPLPLGGRAVIWTIAASVLSAITIAGVFTVDRVVPVAGKIVADTPNIVVQPLDASIVRFIGVKEGQSVHAGDLLARLDPTFATADASASQTQVASLQAEVDRLTAEAHNQPYSSDGSPASQLQLLIFAQRHAERSSKLEGYRQKIDSAQAKVTQTLSDITSYAEQFRAAQAKEGIRRELERLQIGSKLNTLDAGAQRAEINRALLAAVAANTAAKSDLEALIAERDGFVQQMQAEIAQQLTEQGRKLADARDQNEKASLRRKLVELRAERDAVVLNVAKLSVGSVVQSGDELITLVPTDAQLSVEAGIPARDAGFVAAGDPVVIKFDTFAYATYGFARGTLDRVSADSFANPQAGREHSGRPNVAQAEAPGSPTYYRGSISLGELKLRNLPVGFRMTPGMPVTADIKVGQRTVLSYLVSRVVPMVTEGLREP